MQDSNHQVIQVVLLCREVADSIVDREACLCMSNLDLDAVASSIARRLASGSRVFLRVGFGGFFVRFFSFLGLLCCHVSTVSIISISSLGAFTFLLLHVWISDLPSTCTNSWGLHFVETLDLVPERHETRLELTISWSNQVGHHYWSN